jgi:hypothetical protein
VGLPQRQKIPYTLNPRTRTHASCFSHPCSLLLPLTFPQYGLLHGKSAMPGLAGDTMDIADAMGSWGNQDTRCYSAPHLWSMGCSEPSLTLHYSSIQFQAPLIRDIPVQNHNGRGPTGIRINVSPQSGFALSYRRSDLSTYDDVFRPFMPGVIQVGG